MLFRKKNIPNILTLGNLASGFLAIHFIFQDSYYIATVMIALGLVFDMMDGMVARLLKTSSDLGVQLDSLADALTFSVAPGFMVAGFYFGNSPIGLAVGCIIAACGVLRLAIFNLTEGLDHFKGLSTPLFTVFVVALVLSGLSLPGPAAAILFSAAALAMVSPIRFPALKGKEFLRYKYMTIAMIALILILVAVGFDLLVTAITLNILYAGSLVLFALDRNIKKKAPVVLFILAVFIIPLSLFRTPIELIAYPILLSVILSPLIEYSRGKR